MQTSEKKIIQTLKRLWCQKILSCFLRAFLDFAAAFALEISCVLLAFFLLEQSGFYTPQEPFWLPELLFWMLLSTSLGYAGIQVAFSIPTLYTIASELDQKGNHSSLFLTAYCFSLKKEKPVSAQLAIEQASQKSQNIAFFPFFSIPYKRLWAFVALLFASFLFYGSYKNENIPSHKRFPQSISNSSKENPPISLATKPQNARKEKAPQKKPSTSHKKNTGSPQTQPSPSQEESSQKAKYQEKKMQSLFGEGEKWLAPGYLPSASPEAKDQGKSLDIPLYHKFQHQIEEYRNNPLFPPEHRKAIQKYFSIVRSE